MYSINELSKIVESRIKELDFELKPANSCEPIKYILSTGGKRIRPTLMLASCNIFSDDITEAIAPSLGFELFHNFTLIHDDVMDNSPVRRNKKTIHVKWGTNTAILSGCMMMIKAYDYIMKTKDNLLKEVLLLFNKTATEIFEGQQYDMNFEKQNNVTIEEYLEMIRLKTSVLIASCIKTGAMIGGANKKNTDLLYDFGLNAGIAFQLQDDLLDVYGNLEKFGKQIGGDIIEGKKTFLLINALERAKNDNNNSLKELIKNKKINKISKIEKVTEIYNLYKIKEQTERKIMLFYKKAVKALDELEVEKNRKIVLKNFIDKFINREY